MNTSPDPKQQEQSTRQLITAGTCPDHKTDLHILVIDGKPGSVKSGFCGCVYDKNGQKVYRW